MKPSSFDARAREWDTSPRIAIASAVLEKLMAEAVLTEEMVVADLGAGTGLLSLPISRKVKRVIAIDTSSEMLTVLAEKAENNNINNIETLLYDISGSDEPDFKCDILISSMALHHIQDIEILFSHLEKILPENGLIAFADLNKEDGSFHEDNTGVWHYGFTREELLSFSEKHGFKIKFYDTVHYIKRESGNQYGVFLFIAKREK